MPKHGFAGKTRPPEYRIWKAMKTRCTNPNSSDYWRYGGRGIWVCARWLKSFQNFLADMGLRPSRHHSLERLNNNLGYFAANCVWATRRQQANNKRNNRQVAWLGERHTVAEWARFAGISQTLLRDRLNAGWPFPDVLSKSRYGFYHNAPEP